MIDKRLRIHSFLPYSRANGPGLRAVIWLQGCTLGCPGCYNPETHSVRGGQWVSVHELSERIRKLGDGIEGITVSGGEPLQQRPALIELLCSVRSETTLSILVFTGYTWDEVQGMPDAEEFLSGIDVLIAGRYDQGQDLAVGLRGSANQTIHYRTGRYEPCDILSVPTSELIVLADGRIVVSGMEPLPRLG